MNPAQTMQLDEARRAVRQARAQGRRWYLRGVLMASIAVIALVRGGQVNTLIGVVMLVLAVLAASLGHTTRRQAAAMEAKLQLVQAAGTGSEPSR